MKVLVCGGRTYADYDKVKAVLDRTHKKYPITLIIQGGAKGADFLAKRWASENLIPMKEYKADWDKYGKAAGHLRNRQMLELGNPDLVVAFLGGPGTTNMIEQSEKALVPVWDVGRGISITPNAKPDFDFRTYLSNKNKEDK